MNRGFETRHVFEGNEERVSLRVDLYDTMFSEAGSQQVAMGGKHYRVALLQPLDKLRRMVDIGKEKRHGPGRQFDHVAGILPFQVWSGAEPVPRECRLG